MHAYNSWLAPSLVYLVISIRNTQFAICTLNRLRLPKPIYIFFHTRFNCHLALVPEQAVGFGQAGVPERHIFGPRRVMFNGGLRSGGVLDELDQTPNGDWLIVAEVDALAHDVRGS